MTNQIQVETHKDRVVNTSPSLKVDVGNGVEIVRDESPSGNTVTTIKTPPKIEIPERKRRGMDTDTELSSDLDWLVNPNKVAPQREVVEEVPRSNELLKLHSGDSDKSVDDRPPPPPRTYDTETEKSQRSVKIGAPPDTSSEYKPSYEKKRPDIPAFTFPDSEKPPPRSEQDIRKEKSYLLFQYNEKNKGNRYSHRTFTMNNTIEEIRDELEYINHQKSTQISLTSWKKNLLFACEGIVWLNNRYDPFDADMSDWTMDVHQEIMEDGKYDEVLEQLIHKWQARLPKSPELRLVMLLAMSFGFGVLQKKKAKKMEEERKARQNHQAEMDRRMAAQAEELAQLRYVVEQQQAANQQMWAHAQQQQARQQQLQQQQQRMRPPPVATKVAPRPPASTSPVIAPIVETQRIPSPEPELVTIKLKGPSLSAEELKKSLQNDFIDGTVLDDESTDNGEEPKAQVQTVVQAGTSNGEETVTLTESVPPVVKAIQPRKRGRPPKNRQALAVSL